MQSKNQISLFPVPLTRWERYSELKRNLTGKCSRKVFPLGEDDKNAIRKGEEKLQTTQIARCLTATEHKQHGDGNYIKEKELKYIGSLNNSKKWKKSNEDLSRNSSQGERVYDPDGLSSCLSAQGGGQGARTGLYAVKDRQPFIYDDYNSKSRKDNITCTLTPNTGSKSERNGQKVVIPFVVGGTQKNAAIMKDKSPALTQAMGTGGGHTPIIIPVLTPDRPNKRQNGRRFKENGDPSFTLTAQDRHGVMIKEATKKGYAIAKEGDSINLSVPNSKTRRGRVGKGIAQTLDTGMQQHTLNGTRIRRLTPTECERLMSWEDGHTKYGINEKGEKVEISNSQRYKMCGNGVVSNVVCEIIKRLYD